jgi:predicted transcriptional regulator of viral defense system
MRQWLTIIYSVIAGTGWLYGILTGVYFMIHVNTGKITSVFCVPFLLSVLLLVGWLVAAVVSLIFLFWLGSVILGD